MHKKIIRTQSDHLDFIALVKRLDHDLFTRDGADHSYYAQFNKLDKINHTIVVYIDDIPVGCGAIKEFDKDSMEVKRMYTHPKYRGRGLATDILRELEKWTAELSHKRNVLETGKRQPEAIRLYKKNGYSQIENYGPYIGIDNSLCFEKYLTNLPA